MKPSNNKTTSSSLLGGALKFGFSIISDTVKLSIKTPVAATAYCIGTLDEVLDESKKALGIKVNVTNSLKKIATTPIDQLITESENMARDNVKSVTRNLSNIFIYESKESEKPIDSNTYQIDNK